MVELVALTAIGKLDTGDSLKLLEVNVRPAIPVQSNSAMIVKLIEGSLTVFAAHAKNVTVQIVQLCMNVDAVKMISVVHVVLQQSVLDLNVMTSIIIFASAVDFIAKDVRGCIV